MKSLASVWIVALGLALAGCSDASAPVVTYEPEPDGILVSNATAAGTAATSARAENHAAILALPSAFISAPPATFTTGFLAEVRNLTKNSSAVVVPIIDGGFDPVAVPADPGDEVSVEVLMVGGQSTIVKAKVPIRRPPNIVRSTPSKGRTDVALNVVIEVVFSEPVAKSTVTPFTISLRRNGIPVAAPVGVSADGLRATLTPLDPLSPGASYTFVVTDGILDTEGDALAQPMSSDFTTETPPPMGSVRVSTVSSVAAGADIDEDAYYVSIDGGAPRPMGINETATFDGISSGSHTVFLGDVDDDCVVSGGALRSIEVVGGATTAVTFNVSCERPLQFDGMLAFVSERDGAPGIYVGNANGTGIVRLSGPGASETDPSWSPDGKRLAFVSDRGGGNDIYVMNADGSNRIQLTNLGASSSPVWSPDGRKIAFARGAIYIIDLESAPATPISIGPTTGYIDHPAWSPDGSTIAFVSDMRAYDFLFDLYTMRPDGSNLNYLITGPFFWVDGLKFYFQPAWSPDGKKIAAVHCTYAWDNCYPQSTIIIANADGTAQTVLAGSAGFSHPSWSPDGSVIAYSVKQCRDCKDAAIRYVKADGSRSGLMIPNAHSPAWRPQQ